MKKSFKLESIDKENTRTSTHMYNEKYYEKWTKMKEKETLLT